MRAKAKTKTLGPSLNEAYRNFNSARYWAGTKGATFKQLHDQECAAYDAYVAGDTATIVKLTKALIDKYGKPNFKDNKDREQARRTYYGLARESRTKKAKVKK